MPPQQTVVTESRALISHATEVDEASDPFPMTQWSIVSRAQSDTKESRDAWESLFQTYWFPLYAYVRRHGRSPHDAEDVTQSFFASLASRDSLAAADKEKGRLRCYLLTAVGNFLRSEIRKENALKRGGGDVPISLDLDGAENRLQSEQLDCATPDLEFERRWAMQLLADALKELEAEYQGRGKESQFNAFRPFLSTDAGRETYGELASELGMKEGAVRIAVFRARKRFSQILRNRISDTVTAPSEVEAEINHMLNVFST